MYAPSPVVQSDANEYSEMLGYQTVKNTSHSRSFGKQGSRSDSTSDQKRALMLPQELKEMDMWEEIVSLEHTKPIRCGKIKYFEDPTFTARVDWQIPEIPLVDLEEFMQSTKAGAKILSNTSESEKDLDQIGKNDVPSQDEIISRLDQIPENTLGDVISLVKQSSLLNKLSIPELKMNYGGTSEDSKKRMLSDFFESSPDDETLDEVLEQSDLSEDEQETLSLMQEFTVDVNSQKVGSVSEDYKQVQAADVLAKFGFSSIKESDEIPEDLDSINAQLEALFGNALSA